MNTNIGFIIFSDLVALIVIGSIASISFIWGQRRGNVEASSPDVSSPPMLTNGALEGLGIENGINMNCRMEPPYIYVTVHDEVQNILQYNLEGCLIRTDVLIAEDQFFKWEVELRSMLLGRYKGEEHALYVTDASTHDSQVLVFGDCIRNPEERHYGRRPFLAKVVDTDMNRGADHAYGLCFDENSNLYASFQHTGTVLRFYQDSFTPMPLPPSFHHLRRDDYFQGTFVQFGKPREQEKSGQGVRAIARVRTNIWIANEDLNGIAVTSINTGLITHIIPVDNPIGLYYDEGRDVVFVSSKSHTYGGLVFAFDGKTFKELHHYVIDGMPHPTGIVIHNGILYVGEQVNRVILKFDVEKRHFLGKLTNVPGVIEQLILSDC